MELINQQVINDNREIYAKIQRELYKATAEILLATAWFTDEDLFNILSDKLRQGVAVEIIIADNQDNERLDFNSLVAKGASVYKIKGIGYGMMNQKFCVIDRKIALHGSYNWTINAKKYNHESIISTNHQETIDALVENFNATKRGILEQRNEPVINHSLSVASKEVARGIPVESPGQVRTEFEEVLDSMIAAEIGSFDRKLLREQGYLRCSANNGDHQVLYKAFDTLYSVFINDIDVIDDKKKRLISKIEEYRVRSQDTLEKRCELGIDFTERESALTKTNLELTEIKLAAEIDAATKNIDDIKGNKIHVIEQENVELNEQIQLTAQQTITPQMKWFEFIPILIFNAALLVYLFIFYSSAAYILLFAVEDARLSQSQGIPAVPAQIFNPEALEMALSKTGTACCFIFLFVFIPLASAIVDLFVKPAWKKGVSILSFIFGVLGLDLAIAYKIAKAVHDADYLQGLTSEKWRPGMAFTDINFYLVFVFGALGLLLFKLAFKKFMHIFEDRSPDIIDQKNQLKIKQLRDKIMSNTDSVNLLRENVKTLEINIIKLNVDIKNAGIELRELPRQLNQYLQKRRSQLLKDAENIDRVAAIYTIHIQSDHLPVSIDALKDRINVFLEGWNDFLYQEYAVSKAATKTAQAVEVAARWQTEKLYANRVDKRVKITQDV